MLQVQLHFKHSVIHLLYVATRPTTDLLECTLFGIEAATDLG